MGRVLAVDFGAKRIGVAVSDESRWLATPLRTIEGEKALLASLETLLEEHDVDTIVVGLPLNMDGSEGPKARETRAFCERLRERLAAVRPEREIPVELWDERLTTVEAERALRAGGLTRARRRARVDALAARILLQSFLDAHS